MLLRGTGEEYLLWMYGDDAVKSELADALAAQLK
jgi:hypothetical protein